jgi:hypothetical protein
MTASEQNKRAAELDAIGRQIAELMRAGEARRAARKAQGFADAPGGAGGVPTNSGFQHAHEHVHEDGTKHVHVHWHYAGTGQHSQGTTIEHDHEHDAGSAKEAQRTQYETDRINRETPARAKAFRESRLSEQAAGLLKAADPSQSPFQKVAGPTLPISSAQTSVGKTKPGRQIIDTPMPERKRGETDLEYQLRIRRQVEDLGQPTTGQANTAAPLGSSGTSADFGERERAYQRTKANILADAKLRAAEQDRRTERAVDGLGLVGATDTTSIKARSLALMRSRGQSTDEKSPTFFAEYRAALKEIKP